MTDSFAWAGYRRSIEDVRAQMRRLPADAPVRLRKQTSNLFRPRQRSTGATLDATAFAGVIDIDPVARTADVGGMTTYEQLVDATLPYGLMPLVVPELKTITLGGAVTGVGIESTSFRNGCPHESVVEMDILTGAGDVITVAPTNDRRDLFYGFPNSYGSLGYALRLRIELEPTKPFVHLRHIRYDDVASCAEAIATICATRSYDGEPVDFLDGVWFGDAETYLTLGAWAEEAPRTSDYVRDIYYRSIPANRDDWLSVRDYLWRWDTDWFWCSRAFGAQHPTVRRLWPNRWLRSDIYWRMVALERKYGVKRRVDHLRGKPDIEYVIQDIEVSVDRLAEFLTFLDAQTQMSPVWLCPLRLRDATTRWDLYPLDPATTYVNVGFWGGVDLPRGEREPFHNRAIERAVCDLGGRKSLYSTAFYSREDFAATYGGTTYELLKKTYDPDGRFPGLYEKTVERA